MTVFKELFMHNLNEQPPLPPIPLILLAAVHIESPFPASALSGRNQRHKSRFIS